MEEIPVSHLFAVPTEVLCQITSHLPVETLRTLIAQYPEQGERIGGCVQTLSILRVSYEELMRLFGEFPRLHTIVGLLDVERKGTQGSRGRVEDVSEGVKEDVRSLSRHLRGPFNLRLYTDFSYPDTFKMASIRLYLYPTSDLSIRIRNPSYKPLDDFRRDDARGRGVVWKAERGFLTIYMSFNDMRPVWEFLPILPQRRVREFRVVTQSSELLQKFEVDPTVEQQKIIWEYLNQQPLVRLWVQVTFKKYDIVSHIFRILVSLVASIIELTFFEYYHRSEDPEAETEDILISPLDNSLLQGIERISPQPYSSILRLSENTIQDFQKFDFGLLLTLFPSLQEVSFKSKGLSQDLILNRSREYPLLLFRDVTTNILYQGGQVAIL